MTAPPNTPAAAYMDRLSDRLGSFVPGGSRLPPRHPVQVSLVMGVLGVIAGWLTIGTYALSDYFVFEYIDYRGSLFHLYRLFGSSGYLALSIPKFIASGIVLNGCLAFWLQQGRIASIVCFPFIVGAHFVAQELLLAIDYGTDHGIWKPFLLGWAALLPVTITHTIAAAWIAKRHVISLIAVAMLIPALIGAIAFTIVNTAPIDFLFLGFMLGPLDQLIFGGTFFGCFYMSLSVCLGISLWETTPNLKFAQTKPS